MLYFIQPLLKTLFTHIFKNAYVFMRLHLSFTQKWRFHSLKTATFKTTTRVEISQNSRFRHCVYMGNCSFILLYYLFPAEALGPQGGAV